VSHIRCNTARHERGCAARPTREQGIFISFGLIFITLTNNFLFTQDITTVSLSVLLKRTSLLNGFKDLIFVFLFNYVGSVIGTFFFGYPCEFFKDPVRIRILEMGSSKTNLGVGSLVSRDVLQLDGMSRQFSPGENRFNSRKGALCRNANLIVRVARP
jgi:hypothetical protein